MPRPTLRRRTSVLLAACLLTPPAAAQPAAHVTLTPKWKAWPSNQNLIMMFMDSAEVWADAQLTPAVGTLVSYPAPPGSGIGTLMGLVSLEFDIKACDVPAGTWTLSGAGFHGATGNTFGLHPAFFFGSAGAPQPGGDVLNCTPGQFIPPGFPPSSINPVPEIWRGKWSYDTWQPGRNLRFTAVPIAAHISVHYDTINGQPQYATVPATISADVPVEIFMDTGAPPPCFVFITAPPQPATVNAGESVSFTVAYSQNGIGCSTPFIQWRRDCIPLSNGPHISGVNTTQLTISPVTTTDLGRYDAVVGNAHSYTALLTVNCYPNCDASTQAPTLNIADFSCFLAKFAAGHPYANCDNSTAAPTLNIADFSCFIARFALGCD